MRSLAVVLAFLVLGCGGAEPPTRTSAAVVAESNVESATAANDASRTNPAEQPVSAQLAASPADAPTAPSPSPSPAAERVASHQPATDHAPTNHAETPCFDDAPRLTHAWPVTAATSSALRMRAVSNQRRSNDGTVRAPVGSALRVDLAIENVSSEEVVLSPEDATALTEVTVLALDATWTMPLRAADGQVHAGQRVAAGGVLRLCFTLDIPRRPLDASPQDVERAYDLRWPGIRERALPGAAARPVGDMTSWPSATVVVRYPPLRLPVLREPTSYFGMIRVVPREGVSLFAIARQTGVRIGGSEAFLSEQRGGHYEAPEPLPPAAIVQAPPEMRVSDAVARLTAHPDVISATPVMRTDRAVGQCNAYAPCSPVPCCRP